MVKLAQVAELVVAQQNTHPHLVRWYAIKQVRNGSGLGPQFSTGIAVVVARRVFYINHVGRVLQGMQQGPHGHTLNTQLTAHLAEHNALGVGVSAGGPSWCSAGSGATLATAYKTANGAVRGALRGRTRVQTQANLNNVLAQLAGLGVRVG